MQLNRQLVSYLLFDAEVDPNIPTNDTKLSPLHLAVQLNDLEILTLLLQCEKVNVNSQASLQNKETALHMACRLEQIQSV
jgi:ankyrin repeat protein